MQIKLNIFNKWILFQFSIIKKATHWTKATGNITSDGMYVFYWEADLTRESYIKGELEHLGKIYHLGDIHIFQSSEKKEGKSFHAVSFVKLTAKEYIEILNNSSCDVAFKNVPRFTSYRNWILRYDKKENSNIEKPKYLYTLKTSEYKRPHSTAHYELYSSLYEGVKKNQKINSIHWDNSHKLVHLEYPTGQI